MSLKEELKAYRARWTEVEALVEQQRRTASLELRWKQLNAVHVLALGLGFSGRNLDQDEGSARWAKLKEKAANQKPVV